MGLRTRYLFVDDLCCYANLETTKTHMSTSTRVAVAAIRRMDHKQRLSSETTEQLEIESRRMEDRLHVLREIMSVEKARRGASGSLHWQSGKEGPLNRTHKQRDNGNWKVNGTTKQKPLRIRILTEKNEGRAPRCGQCDKSTASLCCVECIESYCTVCFTKFHQKGALAKHHAKPLTHKKPRHPNPPIKCSSETTTLRQQEDTHSTTHTSTTTESHTFTTTQPHTSTNTQPQTGSLWEGSYDEAANAASFQEALAAWRAGGKTVKEQGENTTTLRDTSSNTTTVTATQTTSKASKSEHGDIEIQFSSQTGVSYFERLMVRRHRFDPMLLSRVHKLRNVPAKVPAQTMCQGDTVDDTSPERVPSEYNIFYREEDEIPEIESSHTDFELFDRPTSSVKIEEMGFINEATSTSNTHPLRVVPGTNRQPHKLPRNQKISSAKQVNAHSKTLPAHRPRSVATPTEKDIATSVRNTWAQSIRPSHSDNLSNFFLSGVQQQPQDSLPSCHKSETQDSSSSHTNQFQFASTVWLPGNSIATDPQEHLIDLSTDLPPATTSLQSPYKEGEETDSDSECSELVVGDSEWEWEQHREREECDSRALEELVWELASTMAESRLEERESSSEGSNSTEDDLGCGGLDMEKVMSDFDLYQQQLMEQDSD